MTKFPTREEMIEAMSDAICEDVFLLAKRCGNFGAFRIALTMHDSGEAALSALLKMLPEAAIKPMPGNEQIVLMPEYQAYQYYQRLKAMEK